MTVLMPADPAPFDIEVFFDGECPLCRREIAMLRRRDRRGRIRFTDITAADFDPRAIGLDLATLTARIHGRLPEGELVSGVEVFRRLYAAVGFERLVALSRVPVISQLLDAAYALFAKNRRRLTGRCDDDACDLPQNGAAPV
jgi:predicted DCC family thiol-disulfide oxidoreductase YuxK